MNTNTIVQRLSNYCNVLHDDRMSYGDDVEQFTYLLYLEMANERTKTPYAAEVDRRLSIKREVGVKANLQRAEWLRQAILSRPFGVAGR